MNQSQILRETLQNKEVFFFDFDGVLKDSLKVKSEVFRLLFEQFGVGFTRKVLNHHFSNLGLSRLKKIPLYLSWAGLPEDESTLDEYLKKFSEISIQQVIESPDVAGYRKYLREASSKGRVILISATPQEDLELITRKMMIRDLFFEVHGAPVEKSKVIRELINSQGFSPNSAVMFGDSDVDFFAAQCSNIDFILRKTEFNEHLSLMMKNQTIENFTYAEQ